MAATGERMNGPQPLSAILKAWKPAASGRAAADASAIAAQWAEIVGPDVARRTRAGRLRDGVLVVFTAGSTWSHQLSFLAPTILLALHDRCPGVPVQRLRFVVATGRTKALLDGVRPKSAAPGAHGVSASLEGDSNSSDAEQESDVVRIVARLRRRQQALDRVRAQRGWRRCAHCGAWRPPARDKACAVCAEEARRAADNKIERVLVNAPWLRATELHDFIPGANPEAYTRVRRKLLARWEEQLSAARRRLLRDDLQAADRVMAWSYVMLRCFMQQPEIGRAVVADVLDEQWARALTSDAQTHAREAKSPSEPKHLKTDARAFTRR